MKKIYFLILATLFSGVLLAQPSNDEPCNATQLVTDTTCFAFAGTNVGATASVGMVSPSCGAYSGSDVWYYTIVPPTGALKITTTALTITDGAMAVYSGTCSSLALDTCNDDYTGLMPGLILSGLTPGDTLYIRMYGFAGMTGTFTICVTMMGAGGVYPVFTNNCLTPNCPVTSPSLVQATGVATLGGGGIYGCLGSTPNRIWNAFKATDSLPITVGITSSNVSGTQPDVDYVMWGPFISADSGCAQLAASNIVSCSYSTTGANSFTFNPVTDGYYILLSCNYSNSVGSTVSYSFVSASPVVCDSGNISSNCPGTTMPVGTVCNHTNLSMYGTSSSAVLSCTGGTVYDTWFNFTATSSMIIITIDTTLFDPVIQVFDSVCGGVSLGCHNNGSGGYESDTLSGLVVGNTYWFRVYDYNGMSFSGALSAFSNFSLCLHAPLITGIENNLKNSFTIFPNPFTSQTTITFSEEQKHTTVKVVNVLGEVINQSTISGKQYSLDMSGAAKGIYFVRIEDEMRNVVNRKIVIQ